MTIINDLIHTRELARRRYVPHYGWVQSSDTFPCRIQPKFADSLNRTNQITIEELFLNTAVFRDVGVTDVGSFITVTDTMPTSGETLIAAQSGVELVDGDRLVEPTTGRMYIIRAINEYRDARLWHDEIIVSEASHLDKKWIEPCTILTLTQTASSNYDSLLNQFTSYTTSNYIETPAFGAVAFYDKEGFSRDSNQITRSAKGKMVNEPIVIYMDSDWNVNDNSLLMLRGKKWKIEFIDESFFRVYKIGLRPFTERDANTTLTNRPTQERYVD